MLKQCSRIRRVNLIKRFFDLIAAAVGLVALSPILAGVALAVRFKLGRPVLFKQQRLGYKEQPFYVVKFRTMADARDEKGHLLSDQERITPLGTLLRKTSLDELPQLWNIAKGDMSFVGPRPLFCEYLPFYTLRERRRHMVRPGVTGLAQVNGRNTLLWDDRLELDAKYVDGLSLGGDLKILLMTAGKVVNREDIIVIPGTVQGRLDAIRSVQEEDIK